jgi:hypothetical protein
MRFLRPASKREDGLDKEIVVRRTVSAEELARRKALGAEILQLREKASIAPLTTADLMRQVRDERETDDPGC